MSEAKHTEMYEHMVEDVIDLCRQSRNPVAKKDCLIGLCMAVEMMLDNEHEKVVADRDALLDALIELRDDTPPASSSLRKKIEAVITSVEQHQTRRLGSW